MRTALPRKLLLASVSSFVLAAVPTRAATLEGRLVNGTTGQPGRADRVALMDMSQGMTPVAELSNIEGSFRFEGVSDQTGVHLLLQIDSNGVSYNHTIESIPDDEPVVVEIFDRSSDTSAIAIATQNVFFQRRDDHFQTAEFIEFENSSDPPVTIQTESGPIRVHLPHHIHGEIQASVGSGRMPITRALVPTDEADVYTIDYPLKPGITRVVLRYSLGYEGEELSWQPRVLFPVKERRVMVSPADVQVSAEGMISRESEVEGYQVLAGLPLEVGSVFPVQLAGGSKIATDPHAAENRTSPGTNPIDHIAIRNNRLSSSNTLIILGLSMFMVFALLLALSSQPHPKGASTGEVDQKLRQALSRLADRFVSGEIDRQGYERERDRLLNGRGAPRRPKNTPPHLAAGPKS